MDNFGFISFFVGMFSVFILFGISTQKINTNAINIAKMMCENNDGIDFIDYNQLIYHKVHCKNGGIFEIIENKIQ